jgi:hypothetical protein
MLWIIGIERNPNQVVIQKVDFKEGKYKQPKTLKGLYFETYADEVVLNILHEQPVKIVFDEYGEGYSFKETIKRKLALIGIVLKESGEVFGYINDNNRITYNYRFSYGELLALYDGLKSLTPTTIISPTKNSEIKFEPIKISELSETVKRIANFYEQEHKEYKYF